MQLGVAGPSLFIDDNLPSISQSLAGSRSQFSVQWHHSGLACFVVVSWTPLPVSVSVPAREV